MRQRRMSPALRPHNLTRHPSNEQVDTRATRSQLPTAEARRRPNDRRLQSLRSTNLNESPSKCSRASPRKPLPSPRHLRGTRRLWLSHWLLARDAGPNSPPGRHRVGSDEPSPTKSPPKAPHQRRAISRMCSRSRESRWHRQPNTGDKLPSSIARAASSASSPCSTTSPDARSLPCARAHTEPVAHERHELMPDVHRAKRAAQPPHGGPGHPRQNRPGAKHYINLVEHMKCDAADAARLSASAMPIRRFKKLLGNSASMAAAPTSKPSNASSVARYPPPSD